MSNTTHNGTSSTGSVTTLNNRPLLEGSGVTHAMLVNLNEYWRGSETPLTPSEIVKGFWSTVAAGLKADPNSVSPGYTKNGQAVDEKTIRSLVENHPFASNIAIELAIEVYHGSGEGQDKNVLGIATKAAELAKALKLEAKEPDLICAQPATVVGFAGARERLKSQSLKEKS